MFEQIAAITDTVTTSRYTAPFIGNVFVPDKALPYGFTDTELCLDADFIPRNEAEGSNSCLQLVSYTVLLNPERRKIFVAKRRGGDRRLSESLSIGFGGHVEVRDYQIEDREIPNPFLKCAKRELIEELKLKTKMVELHHLGFARDLSSSTSEHIGSIYYLITRSACIKEKDSFAFGKWADYEEFKDKYYFKLESWSRAVFDYIYEDEYYSKLFRLAK